MDTVLSVLLSVFWGLLMLSVLVFLHEGGHFLAARACGVRVTEFFLGLPCRFDIHHTSRRIGTKFGVTPLLLGGYEQQREQIALLWPQTQGDLMRLFALGYDAISLAENLPQMRKVNAMQQPGMSGQLSVDANGNIVRVLDWATYQNGALVSDSAAPQLEGAPNEGSIGTDESAVAEPVSVTDEQGTTL